MTAGVGRWRRWAALALCVACSGPGTSQTSASTPPPPAAAPTESDPPMHIKLHETSVAIAKPIPVEISFNNPTERPIVREISPEKSLDVEMHLLDLSTGEDLSFTMGKTTMTRLEGDDEYALVTPTPERFEIAARSAFVFEVDLNERLYLRPGKFDVFLTDGATQSNHVALTIEFTRESIDALYQIARDPRADYSRREWAVSLLQKLYREFKLMLPLPDDPPATAAKYEVENEGVYEEFEAWWQRRRVAPGFDETLKQVR